ncbi:MAG: hypothetical protein Q4D96_01655 [Propionibacteriaceae bacterium]|nr:hypothetical protein [Propionibacteriaceae bacterium]
MMNDAPSSDDLVWIQAELSEVIVNFADEGVAEALDLGPISRSCVDQSTDLLSS